MSAMRMPVASMTAEQGERLRRRARELHRAVLGGFGGVEGHFDEGVCAGCALIAAALAAVRDEALEERAVQVERLRRLVIRYMTTTECDHPRRCAHEHHSSLYMESLSAVEQIGGMDWEAYYRALKSTP